MSEGSTPTGGTILISRDAITTRVSTLGEEISLHYKGQRPVFLGVMNGALFFLADLLRATNLDVEISCVRLGSYAGTSSTGKLVGLDALKAEDVHGRHVLIVDDILDTGLTLARLTARLHELGAADIRICVLLQKRRIREVPVRADWVGFEIDDEFVIGYGLDLDGRYRELPDVWTCRMPPPALT